MKKRDLATLALLGIGAGLMVGGCQQRGEKKADNQTADEQISANMQAFYSSLSPEAQEKFRQLDAQHKMMAVEMSQQSCSGKNNCKSMGGCSTAQHACAGQNGCKGEGGTPVKDPNQAVEIQYNNQTGQRQKIKAGF